MLLRSTLTLLALIALSSRAGEAFTGAAVATAHPLATEAGLSILRQGGNAVDAAVAAAMTLGVVEPHASGLGGGGFIVIQMAASEETLVIDYRERAPMATNLDRWRSESGEIDRTRTRRGGLAVATPGTAVGLHLALERAGSLPWDVALAPAILHAEEGFALSEKVADIYLDRLEMIVDDPGLSATLAPTGLPLESGETLVQPQLAQTLRLLAEQGPDLIYSGPVGEEMVRVVGERGGALTTEDLASYAPAIREPVRISYRGHTLVTIGPPSTGSLTAARALRALETLPLSSMSPDSPEAIHRIAGALSEAAAAVEPMVGDLASGEIDIEALLIPSPFEPLSHPEPVTSGSTTHLSVIDADGNAVALTQTINYWLGAGILLPESGVMLNDEMEDFTFEAGHPNAPRPGARPATSMAPMLILDPDGEVIASLGTPGGARIPSAMVQIIVNLLDFGMSIEEAINAPRCHPVEPGGMRLAVEEGFPPETLEALSELGWEIDPHGALDPYFGGAQAVLRDPATGALMGAADPRRDGAVGGL
ncbi:gamma-glutamyltransferase [Candidatus Sumerlaeota bacterium]|nr:gamma-glutamyltransferase [Candidatus Sumerlaeota bacterium]